jgi:hypothetical protein
MGTIEEWEQKIEERQHKITIAFFEYARDNKLPVFKTSYYFARQILPDESIVLKHCIVTCLLESGCMQLLGEHWVINE